MPCLLPAAVTSAWTGTPERRSPPERTRKGQGRPGRCRAAGAGTPLAVPAFDGLDRVEPRTEDDLTEPIIAPSRSIMKRPGRRPGSPGPARVAEPPGLSCPGPESLRTTHGLQKPMATKGTRGDGFVTGRDCPCRRAQERHRAGDRRRGCDLGAHVVTTGWRSRTLTPVQGRRAHGRRAHGAKVGPSPWSVRCRQRRRGLFLAFELRPGTYGIKVVLCDPVDVAGQLTGGLRVGRRGGRPDPVSPFLHAVRGSRVLTHTTFVPFGGLFSLPWRSAEPGQAAVLTTGGPRRSKSAKSRATSASEGVAVMAATATRAAFPWSGV